MLGVRPGFTNQGDFVNTPDLSFDPSAFSYRAFISYSRGDTDIVNDLYARLTRFRAPASLQKTQGAYGHPPRSFRVFLDRMSIEAGGSVPDAIKRKLDDSAFLVVICSKSARDSFWVSEEIKYFLSIASADRILPVLIRESVDDPIEDILPQPLIDLGGDMPIGADLMVDGGLVAVRDKIIGGLLGIAQDRIAREQERADRRALRRRSVALAAISLLFVLSTLAGMAAWNARNDALLAESRGLARASTEATTTHWQPDLGMLLALKALPGGDASFSLMDRPFEPQAAAALAASIYWQGERRTVGQPSNYVVYYSPVIAVSDDGSKWLYGYDRQIEIWDSEARSLLLQKTLEESLGSIEAAAFSPDGETLVLITDPSTYAIMSIETGELLRQGATEASPYGQVKIAPDGSRFIIGRSAPAMTLYEYNTGAETSVLNGHTRRILDFVYSQDGAQVFSRAGDRSIRIWDTATATERHRLVTEEHMGFRGFVTTPDSRVVIAAADRLLQRWALPDAEVTHQSNRTRGFDRSNAMAASPAGDFFVVSEGENISLRSMADLSIVHTFEGHRDQIAHLAFSLDGRVVASTSADRTARLWDVRSGKEIARFVHPNRPFGEIYFTKDGVIAAGRDEAAYFWRLPAILPSARLDGHEDAVPSVNFNLDGTKLVSAGADFKVNLWDMESGALERTFGDTVTHGWIVLGARFDPTGQRVLTFGEDDFALLWDAGTGELLWSISADGIMRDGAFSPDGTYVAVASADGSVGVLVAETGEVKFQSEAHEGGARGVIFSPDGGEVMSRGADGKIRFWDVESGTERLKIDAHGLSVWTARYSPDGRWVVSGSGGGGDGVAMVFDVATGETVARLYPHNGQVRQAVFTTDGKRVLTAAADGFARLWDIETEAVVTSVSSDQRDLSDVAISPDGQRFVTVAFQSDGPSAVLWDIESGQRLADYFGQSSTVLDVEFAPTRPGEPMRFATASYDGAVEIWTAPLPSNSGDLIKTACNILQPLNRTFTRQEALQYGLDWPVEAPC
ncbi:MAG: TIR domain-containing protein [Pseudomonadota bacterium]